MKNKLTLSLIILLLAVSYGCKNDLGKISEEPLIETTKVVAIKTYNPYALESMREALSRLIMKDVQLLANNKQKYAHGTMTSTTSTSPLAINKSLTKKESVILVEKGLNTTHYYIKFMPRNEADMSKLKLDSNLILYPFPLHTAVTKYSGSYRDPSVAKGIPTYQYTSVPIGYVLPNVPYEKLADLYLPNEQERNSLITIKGADGSSYTVTVASLVNESLCEGGEGGGPPGGPIEEEQVEDDCEYGGGGPSTGTGAPAGEWRPSGRITMYDDSLGVIGVEGIKVRARRWFTTYTGITDANGDYHVDGTYTRKANYWLDFERYDFSVNDHHGGPREIGDEKRQGSWDLDLTGYDKFCATIFRAAFHYYYKDIQGLRRPPQNSFWATQLKIAAFDWYEISDKGDMWAGRNLLLGSLIHIYKPQRPSHEVYATTIHELAHAVHWDMSSAVAPPFLTYYGMTAKNVCEAWAVGVQTLLTRMEYPNYKGRLDGLNSVYKNLVIDLIDTPADISYYQSNIFNNYGFGAPEDQVEGYTIIQIQEALKDKTSFDQWKNNLTYLYNNATENNLDALFTAWYNY